MKSNLGRNLFEGSLSAGKCLQRPQKGTDFSRWENRNICPDICGRDSVGTGCSSQPQPPYGGVAQALVALLLVYSPRRARRELCSLFWQDGAVLTAAEGTSLVQPTQRGPSSLRIGMGVRHQMGIPGGTRLLHLWRFPALAIASGQDTELKHQ